MDEDPDTIEISDDDDDGDGDDDDDTSVAGKISPAKKVKVKVEPGTTAPVAVRRSTQPRTSKNVGNEFMKTISSALDPGLQAAMTNDRMTRSIQNTQILTLTNQIRDAQSTIELLRNRVSEVERERNSAERKADKAEMLVLLQGGSQAIQHPRPRRCQDLKYADGGMATIWVGSDESDHLNDSPGTTRFTHDPSPEPLIPAVPSKST
jgi:hypothetical protein